MPLPAICARSSVLISQNRKNTSTKTTTRIATKKNGTTRANSELRGRYSLGVPVNFRRDDVTGTIPGAPQQDTTELDLGAVSAVGLAQVKHINPAVVGERHDRLRVLLAAAAPYAEGGPCPCAHKTNQATSADRFLQAGRRAVSERVARQ